MLTPPPETNPTTLRSYILFEFLDKKPIFDAYRHFCKVLGDETMEYPEFEFWFMRFENKKFDLDYDRSKDPESRKFSDLPEDFLKKVFQETSVIEIPILRQVSKTIRKIVDETPLHYKKGEVKLSDSGVSLTIDGVKIAENFEINEINPYHVLNGDADPYITIDEQKKFSETIFEMSSFMKNFNVEYHKFDEFSLEWSIRKIILYCNDPKKEITEKRWKMAQEFLEITGGFVKKIKIENWKDSEFFLKFLTPGILEEIDLYLCKREFMDSEQWKMAKIVKIRSTIGYKFNLEDFLRFPIFEADCDEFEEQLVDVKNKLIQLPHFKKCELHHTAGRKMEEVMEEFEKSLGDFERKIERISRIYTFKENDRTFVAKFTDFSFHTDFRMERI